MICFCDGTLIIVVSMSISLLGIWFYYRIEKKLQTKFREYNLKYVSYPNLIWLQMTGQFLEKIELRKVKENGTVFGASVFMTPAFVVAEPELIQIILSKEFTNFTDRRVSIFCFSSFSYLILSRFILCLIEINICTRRIIEKLLNSCAR